MCRLIARTDGTSVGFDGLGHSCRSIDWTLPEAGHAAGIGYGCRPRVDLAGLIAYGKGDFTAEIDLPPDSPGVVLTLVSGEVVLIRPLDQQVIFAGPLVDHMEIFYADGAVDTISTVDCR